jgi:hypothetical protein
MRVLTTLTALDHEPSMVSHGFHILFWKREVKSKVISVLSIPKYFHRILKRQGISARNLNLFNIDWSKLSSSVNLFFYLFILLCCFNFIYIFIRILSVCLFI